MIKQGKSLYATKAGGRWFIKQAKSPRHFIILCVEDEKANGYVVPPRFRNQYAPDLVWSENRRLWLNADGSEYGPRLPHGAIQHTISFNNKKGPLNDGKGSVQEVQQGADASSAVAEEAPPAVS